MMDKERRGGFVINRGNSRGSLTRSRLSNAETGWAGHFRISLDTAWPKTLPSYRGDMLRLIYRLRTYELLRRVFFNHMQRYLPVLNIEVCVSQVETSLLIYFQTRFFLLENKYIQRDFGNIFKYFVTFKNIWIEDSSQVFLSRQEICSWRMNENNRVTAAHWKFIAEGKCQSWVVATCCDPSSGTRLSRHLVATNVTVSTCNLYVHGQIGNNSATLDVDDYRITSIGSDQAHLFHLHDITSSLLPRCYCREYLPSAVVPRSYVHSAAVPWRLAHPLYSPATPSSSTVGWNVTTIVIRDKRGMIEKREVEMGGKRRWTICGGGVEKEAIRNRMLIHFVGSFGDFNNNLKNNILLILINM